MGVTSDAVLIERFNAVTQHAPAADIERASGFTNATIRGYQEGRVRLVALTKPTREKLKRFIKANPQPIETLAQTDSRLIDRALSLVDDLSASDAAKHYGVASSALTKWRTGGRPGVRGMPSKQRTRMVALVSRQEAESRVYMPASKSGGAPKRPAENNGTLPDMNSQRKERKAAADRKPGKPIAKGDWQIAMTLQEFHEALGDTMSWFWIAQAYKDGRISDKLFETWVEYRNP